MIGIRKLLLLMVKNYNIEELPNGSSFLLKENKNIKKVLDENGMLW